jgi:exopolysaccharide production protein ExoQ
MSDNPRMFQAILPDGKPTGRISLQKARFDAEFAYRYLRDHSGTFWVAFFFLIFDLNVLPKIASPAAILGCALCFLLYYREFYYFVLRKPIVVLYAVLVLLSGMWSTTPTLSLWYGLQLCLTVAAAVLMGIATTPRQLVRGIFVGMAIVIVASVLSGRRGASAIGPVLVGITGGKTAIGIAAAALFSSGLAVLFDRGHPRLYRIASVALIPLGAYIATHVESASAKVSLMVFPFAFFGLLSLRYVTPLHRWALVVIFFALAVPLVTIVASTDIADNANQKILRVLNKDSTLTGRTLMWAKADAWIQNAPILGYGFRAFWTSGSSDSLGILHFNRVPDPRGFQLHNTIKEIRVDTGLIGLFVFLATAAFFLYYVCAFVFFYPSAASAYLASTYLLMIAFASIGTIIGVFFPITAFFYVTGVSAVVFFMNKQAEASQPDIALTTDPDIALFASSRR